MMMMMILKKKKKKKKKNNNNKNNKQQQHAQVACSPLFKFNQHSAGQAKYEHVLTLHQSKGHEGGEELHPRSHLAMQKMARGDR